MKRSTLLFLLVGIVGVTPAVARGEQSDLRKSPLADAPAIRKRLELRDGRVELGAGLQFAAAEDFYNAVLAGVRIGYHLNDWLAVAGVASFNLTPNFHTGLNDNLLGSLPLVSKDRSPTRQQALDGMNKIGEVLGVQAELVPFTGKYSLFGKFFSSYDFYLFGGPGFINFTADKSDCSVYPASCPDTGFKVGANFGFGIHSFITDLFAINIEVRDVLVKTNRTGRDVTGDRRADSNDLSLDHTFLVSVNAMFFLPAHAKIGP